MSDPETRHDPGGKVKIKLPDGVIGGARFSECGRYRQALTRDWTPEGHPPKTVLFVGMNPSVAAADVSDPTCHRELMFARDWGFTRYLKGNVLDWRATSPKDIPADPSLACSQENIPLLREMANEADLIIMAYGKLHKRHHGVLEAVIAAMVASGAPLQCLGLNKDGSAKHPLYLRKDTKPFPYPVT
ncbi:MAG: DUF1643 domain-containing protein [Pseudomonadota bacterium]